MRTALSLFAVLSCVAAAAPAFGQADPLLIPGKNAAGWIAYYNLVEPTGAPTPGGTVTNLGQAIAGGFYGNTANAGIDGDAPANGHGVTAPCSPGPKVGGCNWVPGSSFGNFLTGNGPDTVPNLP